MSFRVSCVIHLIGYYPDVILQFRGNDLDSRAHFRSKSFQRFIYFNKNQHFVLMASSRENVRVFSSEWCDSRNWKYLNDADGFIQFRDMIRVLDLISVPKHSRDSYI